MSDTMTDIPGVTVTAPAVSGNDDLSLIIGDRQIAGWQEIRLTRGIERMPADFEIVTTERYPGAAEAVIKAGDPCEVRIGGDLVLTGYVDRYAPSIDPAGHRVLVSGRGKCADLVDCAAIFEDADGKPTGTQLSGVSALALAQQLARPYGIQVTALDIVGDVIQQFNAILSETPFEIIDRVSRAVGLLAYDGADGNLILAQVGKRSMASGFKQGENVERAGVTISMDQRFSEYRVILLPTENLQDISDALNRNDWNTHTTVRDTEVPRRRQRVILAEQMWGGVRLAEQRGLWEKARRYGRSQAVSVTCDSWRDSAGKLWEPNTRALVHLPALKLENKTWVIGEVSYRRGADGTHADLILMPQEAFMPQPTILQPFDSQVYEDMRQQGIVDGGGGPIP